MSLEPEKKLKNCPKGKQFWAANGGEYHNLYDLERGLQEMDEGTFRHHVNEQKNDFKAWVHDVVKDTTLAQGLHYLGDKDSMTRRVALRIRFLELMKDAKPQVVAAKVAAKPKVNSKKKPAARPMKKTAAVKKSSKKPAGKKPAAAKKSASKPKGRRR